VKIFARPTSNWHEEPLTAVPAGGAWPLEHPVIASLAWTVLLLAVFVPLCTVRYAAGEGSPGAHDQEVLRQKGRFRSSERPQHCGPLPDKLACHDVITGAAPRNSVLRAVVHVEFPAQPCGVDGWLPFGSGQASLVFELP
jgi:hypothetical protein